MIEIGKEYIFNYRIETAEATKEDVELCIINSGLNCKVIDDNGTDKYGHMYEVESCTGSQFFAYESELDELEEGKIYWWME